MFDYPIICPGCGVQVGTVSFPTEKTADEMTAYCQGYLCADCVAKNNQPEPTPEIE